MSLLNSLTPEAKLIQAKPQLIKQNLLGYVENPTDPKNSAHGHSILEYSMDPFKHKFGRTAWSI
jgi:hypothetical protein